MKKYTKDQFLLAAESGDNKYLHLLQKFVSNDLMCKWITIPFNAGDKTIATNGYSLISTPIQDGFEDRSEKIRRVYPIHHNANKVILVDEIKQKLTDYPLVDCFEEIKSECDACDGNGDVVFEFYYDGKCYERNHDCPICDGQGAIFMQAKTPNRKKKLDSRKLFQIGICVFNVARIEELVFVADILNSDIITIVNQTERNKASLFQIKDVEILVMPMVYSDEQDIAQKIL